MGGGARARLGAWTAVLAGALALRAIDLGARPLQYDEGQIAYFSLRLLRDGSYEYDPLLHGPLQYFLDAAVFGVLGTSDALARLVAVLAGIALVALPLALRRRLGTAGALAAAVALACSPAFVYYTRFGREDALEAALLLALLAVAVRLFDAPRRWHPVAAGALLALLFATKETAFITVAIAVAGLLGALAGGWPVLRALRRLGARAWLAGAGAFAAVFGLLFSALGAHPRGILDGVWRGPSYWAGEHEVGRGGEGWAFYLVQIVAQEPFALALGVAGIVVAVRRREPLGLWLAWWFAASLAVYSYAGERFAWLVLHPLLPLCLLAGIGAQALWSATAGRRGARIAVATALAGAIGLTTWSAIGASFERATDPRELLVVVQTDDDVLRVRDEVLARVRRRPRTRVLVDATEHNAFPWAWYLRDVEALYGALGERLPRRDELLLTTADAPVVDEALVRGWSVREFTIRRFWGRDYGALSAGGLLRWALRREPWSPTGELRGALISRP